MTAGIGKLLDLEGSRRALSDFGVPARLTRAGGVLLPVAELAAAVALIFRPSARWGAAAALLLLAAFIVGIGRALARGEEPDCHCFGQIHSSPAGPLTLARNAVLAAFAGVILGYGSGPALDAWVSARSPAVLVAIGVGICALLAVGYALTLRGEIKQLKDNLSIAQARAATARPGLPVGYDAPPFELPDMQGQKVTLAELQESGQPILLVFVSPTCPPCALLLPRVQQWQQTLSARLKIVLISSGTAKQNAELEEQGLDNVLLQEAMEVAERYGVDRTPSAMFISTRGTVASAVGESANGIEPLVRLALRDGLGAALDGSPA
jgi:peroxiredoxin